MAQDTKSLRKRADATPEDVGLQIEAAYALDSAGDEKCAAAYYDRAFKLGVPEKDRVEFLLGYGSTLKNVGRLDQSNEVLRSAIAEAPNDPALPVFLALTQHARSKSGAAIAGLIRHILRIGKENKDLQAYSPALISYAEELDTENS